MSTWNTSSEYCNFTEARPGTPLRASCVEVPQGLFTLSGSPQPGQYVSLVLLSALLCKIIQICVTSH